MAFQQQPFRDSPDRTAMLRLAQAHPASHEHVIDLPYRLCSWALDDPDNVSLWKDGRDRLVGWGVMQLPFWTVDLAIDPAAQDRLLPLLLAWADDRARVLQTGPHARSTWFVHLFADLDDRQRILEQAGFLPQADVGEESWSKLYLERAGSAAVPDFRVPPGFSVRNLQGEVEVAAYVELHRATFGSKNMTPEWRQRLLHLPSYSPDLDIVIEDPSGRLGAFCIGWLERQEDGVLLGQIEPLGCHPDFRRYALGRVALAEVLRRMKARGVRSVCVETDSYRTTARDLYESLGFQFLKDILVFRKDFSGK